MSDPFTAGKSALEDSDRTRDLVAQARAHLDKLDRDWRHWERERVLDELIDLMSWPDACLALNHIDWEDNHK